MRRNQQRPLWAPWRIEFIRSHKKGVCFLCDKKDNTATMEEPLIISRGEKAYVIMNRFPYNSGHLMVAPYRHVADISLLEKDELYEIMDLTVMSKNVLTKVMRPDGFNAGFNIGAASGAGLVEHIHFHIVPRWVGDTSFMPVLGDARIVPETLKNTAEMIKKAWSR